MGAVTERDTAKDANTVSVYGEGLPVYETKGACQADLQRAIQKYAGRSHGHCQGSGSDLAPRWPTFSPIILPLLTGLTTKSRRPSRRQRSIGKPAYRAPRAANSLRQARFRAHPNLIEVLPRSVAYSASGPFSDIYLYPPACGEREIETPALAVPSPASGGGLGWGLGTGFLIFSGPDPGMARE
jgi:hypothetical protein